MHKKGSVLGTFILLILLALLGISVYYLYLNWPKEPVDLISAGGSSASGSVNGQAQILEADYNSVSKQFYDNMRYKDKQISYYIFNSCDQARKDSMAEAFSKLEELTILDFHPGQADAEIVVLCSDVAPEASEQGHFVAGEGGPSEVLNSTLYSVILKGKISLFREDRCVGAKIATHELLHALGFDHNNNRMSILYPTLDCDQEIEPQIITDLNNLYATKSLPELSIYTVSATKNGRYLNFDIEVINRGLEDAQGAKLGIYADDKFVKSFDLGEIVIGARKILNVENLKIPSSASRISFVVDYDNTIKEISDTNNEVELVLSG